MAMKFLLDTNAAIDYIGGTLPNKAIAWLDGLVDTELAFRSSIKSKCSVSARTIRQT